MQGQAVVGIAEEGEFGVGVEEGFDFCGCRRYGLAVELGLTGMYVVGRGLLWPSRQASWITYLVLASSIAEARGWEERVGKSWKLWMKPRHQNSSTEVCGG